MTPPASPSPTPIANIENQPLVLGDTVGNPSTGDGTLDLAVGYQIVTMP